MVLLKKKKKKKKGRDLLLLILLLLWLLLCIPHHDARLEQQMVDGLSDVGRVHQVVIGVFVLAVAHLQRADEGDEGRDRDLDNTRGEERKGEVVCLTGTEGAVNILPAVAVLLAP